MSLSVLLLKTFERLYWDEDVKIMVSDHSFYSVCYFRLNVFQRISTSIQDTFFCLLWTSEAREWERTIQNMVWDLGLSVVLSVYVEGWQLTDELLAGLEQQRGLSALLWRSKLALWDSGKQLEEILYSAESKRLKTGLTVLEELIVSAHYHSVRQLHHSKQVCMH